MSHSFSNIISSSNHFFRPLSGCPCEGSKHHGLTTGQKVLVVALAILLAVPTFGVGSALSLWVLSAALKARRFTVYPRHKSTKIYVNRHSSNTRHVHPISRRNYSRSSNVRQVPGTDTVFVQARPTSSQHHVNKRRMNTPVLSRLPTGSQEPRQIPGTDSVVNTSLPSRVTRVPQQSRQLSGTNRFVVSLAQLRRDEMPLRQPRNSRTNRVGNPVRQSRTSTVSTGPRQQPGKDVLINTQSRNHLGQRHVSEQRQQFPNVRRSNINNRNIRR